MISIKLSVTIRPAGLSIDIPLILIVSHYYMPMSRFGLVVFPPEGHHCPSMCLMGGKYPAMHISMGRYSVHLSTHILLTL